MLPGGSRTITGLIEDTFFLSWAGSALYLSCYYVQHLTTPGLGSRWSAVDRDLSLQPVEKYQAKSDRTTAVSSPRESRGESQRLGQVDLIAFPLHHYHHLDLLWQIRFRL